MVTHCLIPAVYPRLGVEPVVAWFLLGGFGVFVPLGILAAVLLRGERRRGMTSTWPERLRFRRMSGRDWAWTIGALLAVALLSAAIERALAACLGGANLQPPFMSLEPLGPGRYWLLAAWIPFWLANILGEEVLWRGILLPRQEAALGARAWLANAAGWCAFHVAFGWQLMLVLLPIVLILPYVAQRTRNTWPAVVIHAGLNGPGFLAVAFGLV